MWGGTKVSMRIYGAIRLGLTYETYNITIHGPIFNLELGTIAPPLKSCATSQNA